LRLGLLCLLFELRNLRPFGLPLCNVGLPDALLFGLLHAPQGLLLGLLLQEDVPTRDCPAAGLLCCCLL
jgi:hypothetical protein